MSDEKVKKMNNRAASATLMTEVVNIQESPRIHGDKHGMSVLGHSRMHLSQTCQNLPSINKNFEHKNRDSLSKLKKKEDTMMQVLEANLKRAQETNIIQV